MSIGPVILDDEVRWIGVARRAIFAGAVLRVVYGLIVHPPLDYVTSDMAQYVARALRLGGGGHIPRSDYFMPFGTQLLISLPVHLLGTGRSGLWGASVLWCGLSCLYPWVAWKWARELLSPRGAAIVAVASAVSPLAVIYGGYFSSELPAIVLLPATLWLVHRLLRRPGIASAVWAGCVAVLLLTVRQQFALNLMIAGVGVVAAVRHHLARVVLAVAAGAVASLAVVVVLGAPPWRVTGGLPPLAGQNGGLNFFYGHCDANVVTTADLVFENPVRAQRHSGTNFVLKAHRAADQGYFYHRGLSCITDNPARAAVLLLRSVADLTATSIPFPPWTEGGAVLLVAEASNAVFCLLLVALLVSAAAHVATDRVARLLVAHLLCVVAVAVAFLGEPRYRIPYDTVGWVLLGWALTRPPVSRGTGPGPTRFEHFISPRRRR